MARAPLRGAESKIAGGARVTLRLAREENPTWLAAAYAAVTAEQVGAAVAHSAAGAGGDERASSGAPVASEGRES